VAARIVGREDAADVSQEVFLKAFRSIGQFVGDAEVGTWLHRIAVNESLQHLRRKKAARLTPLEYDPVDRSVSTIGRIQQQDLLERAIELLSADLRGILVLREREDLSYAQISQMLDISAGTVASRINRARGELKRHLIDLGWELEDEMLTGPKTVVRFSR
jgi:RNA polymerase sigma-70 factor (ECF subfamily)